METLTYLSPLIVETKFQQLIQPMLAVVNLNFKLTQVKNYTQPADPAKSGSAPD